jgi:hypothetical protein
MQRTEQVRALSARQALVAAPSRASHLLACQSELIGESRDSPYPGPIRALVFGLPPVAPPYWMDGIDCQAIGFALQDRAGGRLLTRTRGLHWPRPELKDCGAWSTAALTRRLACKLSERPGQAPVSFFNAADGLCPALSSAITSICRVCVKIACRQAGNEGPMGPVASPLQFPPSVLFPLESKCRLWPLNRCESKAAALPRVFFLCSGDRSCVESLATSATGKQSRSSWKVYGVWSTAAMTVPASPL